jgi:hypothetical protein
MLLVLDKERDLNYNLPYRVTGQHNVHALLHCVFHGNDKTEQDRKQLLQSERLALLLNRLLQPMNTNDLGNFGNFGDQSNRYINGNFSDLGNFGNFGDQSNRSINGNFSDLGNFGNFGDQSNQTINGNFSDLDNYGNFGDESNQTINGNVSNRWHHGNHSYHKTLGTLVTKVAMIM